MWQRKASRLVSLDAKAKIAQDHAQGLVIGSVASYVNKVMMAVDQSKQAKVPRLLAIYLLELGCATRCPTADRPDYPCKNACMY
jgi:hypothetical protein